MLRTRVPFLALVFASLAVGAWLGGCPPAVPAGGSGTPSGDTDGPALSGGSDTPGNSSGGTGGDTTGSSGGETTNGGTTAGGGTAGGAIPGVLQFKAFTDSLGAAARIIPPDPAAQQAPSDIDVRLTPTAYAIAFKRIVLKHVDNASGATLAEIEVFTADTVDQARVVDLGNASAADVLSVENLPVGVYNKVDIEVFYLDMTIATLFPGTESHDIPYRMVFENMGVLRQRDFLLWLDPAWMTGFEQLSAEVTQPGWYWMKGGQPDHVLAVAGAAEAPTFPVLDLFANDVFWSSPHKVLEGGRISPALHYDPAAGAVVTINFDVHGTFDFKDYHDETTPPDGLWEIRRDAGIHPFPPNFTCVPTDDTATGGQ